ncbi:hypothetical protein SAMN05660429_02837 [Thalassotalea agarivorans]|uniref:Uncharacterized protein n=1 Tax=Thalassotalea agarivorans TaxID=349064 RepID=A0A1I0HLE3_THASX|nr:hypothetical protein SAMN05660429_02837 [Thalassotalea agarivorans]
MRILGIFWVNATPFFNFFDLFYFSLFICADRVFIVLYKERLSEKCKKSDLYNKNITNVIF